MAYRSSSALLRYRGIVTGAASAVVSRGLAVAASLLAVSFALPQLGTERFGLFVTIATIQIWLQLADLGLPAGVHTRLSASLAAGDDRRTRQLIWQAALSIAVSCAAIFFVVACAASSDTLNKWLQIQSDSAAKEFGPALAWGAGIALLATPAVVVSKVLTLQHRAHIANAWAALGQALAIAALVIASQQSFGLVATCGAMSAAVTVAAVGNVVWFIWRQPRFRPQIGDFRLMNDRAIWALSGSYSALQLGGMLLMNAPLLIVSFSISAQEAASFATASRLAAICTVVAQIVSLYFWASYSDAIARKEHAWLRGAFKKHVVASLGSTLALALVVMVFGQTIIERWTDGRVQSDFALLGWLVLWQCIVAAMNPAGALLNAFDAYALQTVLSLIAGVVAAVCGWLLAARAGAWVVVAATSLAYLVLVAPPVVLRVRKLLNKS